MSSIGPSERQAVTFPFTIVDTSERGVPGHLTFPSYRSLFARSDPSVVALAAQSSGDGTPVGAILLTVEEEEARVLSLAVAPEARRRGVGRALLSQALATAEGRGARRADIVYTTKLKTFPALEGFLAAGGWSQPQRRMIFGSSDPRTVWRQDWVQRQLGKAPRGSDPFPWAELTTAERRQIADDLAGGLVPEEVSPFWDEDNIVWPMTQGLRRGGRVVGWLVCHVVPQAPGTIRYSRSFASLLPDSRGNGPWLIAHALDRHVSSSLLQDYPTGLFDVVCDNKPMMAVFAKRLEPFLQVTYDSRQCSLLLGRS
jgi:GNAT superfamily N-acetyltransferase